MSANIQVMNRFPRWEQTWQDSLPQVDEQITQFCETCAGAPEQSLPELQEHIQNWFEDQDLDAPTQAEYEKLKHDPEYLENQVAGRLSYLKQQGRVVSGLSMQAGSAGE